MKKGRMNFDDELYEEDEYYDDDYDEEYEEEEEEKPKKNKNKKNKQSQNNNNINNNNNKNQPKIPENKSQNNPNKTENSKINSMDLSKKDSNISNTSNISSSLALSPLSSSSITNSTKEKEKEKQIKSLKDLNTLESYPKIDYGSNFSPTEEKPTIHLVIIGHVDSGKSTMIGHLLLLLNLINEKDFKKKYKFGSQTKESLQYAFATDESTSERERGVTIEVGFKSFFTKNKNVVVLDAPGHKDFVPNMIAGASAADYALLVIDSGINAFDAGFFRGGRTKEHALLAKTLGISKIIVAINKLELFNWEEKRYNEIVEILKNYLVNELGFKTEDIFFIPTSAYTGDNLIKPIESKNAKWYKGPVLIDLIDSLPAPNRAIDGPVRFIINDVNNNSISGTKVINLFGKLDSGVILKNKEYIVLPNGNKEKIKGITINDNNNVDYIIPGQQAELHLSINKNKKDEYIIEKGNILCLEKYPVPCVKIFKAHINTYNLAKPIMQGEKMMFYLQGQQTQIVIKKIEKIYNEGNTVSRNNAKFIPKYFNADVIIHCDDKICAELLKLNKRLSIFTLRIKGETEAMGYITEFIE